MTKELDFSKINKERVGYSLRADEMNSPRYLEALDFEDFIPPYTFNEHDPQGVFLRLEQMLNGEIKQQEFLAREKRNAFIDVAASSALLREALMNSMRLIQENYLQEEN